MTLHQSPCLQSSQPVKSGRSRQPMAAGLGSCPMNPLPVGADYRPHPKQITQEDPRLQLPNSRCTCLEVRNNSSAEPTVITVTLTSPESSSALQQMPRKLTLCDQPGTNVPGSGNPAVAAVCVDLLGGQGKVRGGRKSCHRSATGIGHPEVL
jgi:hypothetical protein